MKFHHITPLEIWRGFVYTITRQRLLNIRLLFYALLSSFLTQFSALHVFLHPYYFLANLCLHVRHFCLFRKYYVLNRCQISRSVNRKKNGQTLVIIMVISNFSLDKNLLLLFYELKKEHVQRTIAVFVFLRSYDV